MTTYQQILIILDNFEINFIWALFPPETAVVAVAVCVSDRLKVTIDKQLVFNTKQYFPLD